MNTTDGEKNITAYAYQPSDVAVSPVVALQNDLALIANQQKEATDLGDEFIERFLNDVRQVFGFDAPVLEQCMWDSFYYNSQTQPDVVRFDTMKKLCPLLEWKQKVNVNETYFDYDINNITFKLKSQGTGNIQLGNVEGNASSSFFSLNYYNTSAGGTSYQGAIISPVVFCNDINRWHETIIQEPFRTPGDTSSTDFSVYNQGTPFIKWYSLGGGTWENLPNVRVDYEKKGSTSSATALKISRNKWYTSLFNLEPMIISDDPNAPAGISGTGGGQNGTFDGQSDDINVPNVSNLLSAVDTGFVTIYNPILSEIKALSSYMWNANITTIDFWKKLVADPMDLIIGLNIVPCAVPDGGRQSVKVGFVDTGVIMTKAASQYQVVDCGTLTVEPFWDNVMDFSPFTKCKIYLPYIGLQDLNIDEIMGKTIQVVYHIDILSCACTAMIKCGNSVLYTFQGQCGQSIPVTSANYATMISGILQIAGAAAAIGVTGGAAAPAAAAGISSGAGTLLNGVPIEMTDPMQTGIPAGAPGGGMPAKSSGGGNAVHGTMQTVGNVMALKPSFAHSGSLSGTGGQLGVQVPFLIFERPRQSLPQGYKSFRGYPSNITATLGSLSGYTEVDSIHLDGIPALAPEIQELEKLLKSGVIL